jgi:hypothetical protein
VALFRAQPDVARQPQVAEALRRCLALGREITSLELHPEGALLGAARIDLRLFTVEPASGPAGQVCKLAEAAVRDPGFRRQLLERRRSIRQVARELPELLPAGPPPIVGGPKVERNAPCPCGSGKKYKRCCGR